MKYVNTTAFLLAAFLAIGGCKADQLSDDYLGFIVAVFIATIG